MSVRLSLLAILDQGPCYGYQLRSEFDRRTGSARPLNVGQIYNTLDRLERDGLVKKAAPSASNVEPSEEPASSQIYYRITDAGSAEVAGWFASAVERSATAREDLAIKLAIAVTLPGVDASNVIRVQRSAATAALQELMTEKNAASDPAFSEELARLLIVDSMIFHAEAEIRWLDHSEGRLAHAVHSGRAAPVPLNTLVPKRGRPNKASAG